VDTEIAANTVDYRKPSASVNAPAEVPFYLGIPIRPSGGLAIPMMRQCTCQVEQPNGIWIAVIDD
jgi:hypothetical protein